MTTPPAASPDPARSARRCNADYRWTKAKVLTLLRALARCGKVAQAARGVGMSRQSAYELKARLPVHLLPVRMLTLCIRKLTLWPAR